MNERMQPARAGVGSILCKSVDIDRLHCLLISTDILHCSQLCSACLKATFHAINNTCQCAGPKSLNENRCSLMKQFILKRKALHDDGNG